MKKSEAVFLSLIGDFKSRVTDVGWNFRTIINEFLKFNIVGTFNFFFALTLYEVLYWVDLWPAHTAVAAWAVSTAIGNVEAHFMHYKFTFKSAANYTNSLRWAVTVYTTILIISTITMHIFVEELEIYHRFAWAINTVLFGYVNFAFLRWLAFPPEFDKAHLSLIEEE